MKINGVEVDMQKVVDLFYKETITKFRKDNLKMKEGKIKKIREWWDSEPGMIRREKMSEYRKTHQINRTKKKYEINEEGNDEKIILEGQNAVAAFLGYKRFNSDLRYQSEIGIIRDITGTKKYNIKEII